MDLAQPEPLAERQRFLRAQQDSAQTRLMPPADRAEVAVAAAVLRPMPVSAIP